MQYVMNRISGKILNIFILPMFLGGGGTYLGQHAKNKNLGKITQGKNKTTKAGDVSRKKARNDTVFLLHPP